MKMCAASLLLIILLSNAAAPLCAQTRPRRVAEATAAPAPEAFADVRPRTVGRREASYETARRRDSGRWPRVLLGVGLAMGGLLGSRSCTPSRGAIGRLPHFTPGVN